MVHTITTTCSTKSWCWNWTIMLNPNYLSPWHPSSIKSNKSPTITISNAKWYLFSHLIYTVPVLCAKTAYSEAIIELRTGANEAL